VWDKVAISFVIVRQQGKTTSKHQLGRIMAGLAELAPVTQLFQCQGKNGTEFNL
jgi:hypothetical protein